MMGIIEPTGGSCKIAGVNPTDYKKLARLVGVTPQFGMTQNNSIN
jgi:ABC-type multidrug transport system ATPase subunit